MALEASEVGTLLYSRAWLTVGERLLRGLHRALRRRVVKEGGVLVSLLEAKVLVEEYRQHYNHARPHSALGYLTPTEYAAATWESAGEYPALAKELPSVTVLS